MNLTYKKRILENGLTQFDLEGKILSVSDTEDLVSEYIELIEKGKNEFILNLNKLDYINSTGLNFIISMFTKARNAGGELVICEVSEKVQDLLVITKLNTIFTSFDTLEEAKNNFKIKTINN